MTLFSDNVDLFAETMPRKRFRGVTGRLDDDGLVYPNPNIGLEVGRTWVRMSNQRTAVAVLNARVTTQRANIPVIVEENDNGNLEIIGIDTEDAIFTYGSFAPSLNMPDKIPEQEKGSVSHRRIQELRLRLDAAGGLTLYVNPGIYQVLNGDIKAFLGDDIDLTASVPAGIDTKRIILIGITTATNTLTSSAVTAVSVSTVPTTLPYFTTTEIATARNAASASVLWLWAVPLFYGQTSFDNIDSFVDLRPISWEEGGVYQVTATAPIASSGGSAPNISLTGIVPIANGGTGQATKTPAFDALAPSTTKGDVIAYDGADNVRLAVGSTNGMQLVVDSSAATGLAWTSVGNTLQATLQTTGNTITNLIAYTVAELVAVTLAGRIVASKSDKTAAFGASFRVTYRRQTGGTVQIIGTGWSEQEEDSAGAPVITFDVDGGTNTGRVRWTGISAETWDVKAWYSIIAY
jgi:hypothetical protein